MLIECCKHNRRAKSWYITPQNGYIECIMTFLRDCPACGRSAIRLDRFKMKNKKVVIEPYTLMGGDAWDLFLRLESSIIRPFFLKENENRSNLGYNFNQFGTIQKGYAGISALKIGRIKPNIDFMDVKFKNRIFI